MSLVYLFSSYQVAQLFENSFKNELPARMWRMVRSCLSLLAGEVLMTEREFRVLRVTGVSL